MYRMRKQDGTESITGTGLMPMPLSLFLLRSILISFVVIITACGQSNDVQDLEQATKKWKAQSSNWTAADIKVLARGESLYRKNCSACHKRDGSGELTIGAPPLSNNPLLHRAGNDTIKRVLHSRPGSTMPAFSSTLSADEIAAIISYCANEWSNRLGHLIRPEQVSKLR